MAGTAAKDMSVMVLEKDFPKIYSEVFDLGIASLKEKTAQVAFEASDNVEKAKSAGKDFGIIEGKVIGAKEERERILAVESMATPGNEKLVQTLKADGKTTGPEAAVKMIQADKAAKASGIKTLADESVDPIEGEVSTESTGDNKTLKETWDADAGLRAEFNDDFASCEAYNKGVKAGDVKIFGKKLKEIA